MFLFLKSLSRSVHDEEESHHHRHHRGQPKNLKFEEEGTCKSLTVWRKSLLFNCTGFTVIDSGGNLVYRVDNYTGHPNEVILMDGLGNTIFSIYRRKQKLRLVDNWFVYEGEASELITTTKSLKKPIFCARKDISILKKSNVNVLANVYHFGTSDERNAYVIEGSYAHRSCKVLDESRRVVAEIKKKEATIGGGVSFGLEVFVLNIRPGFDPGFSMAVVLLLDQMFS